MDVVEYFLAQTDGFDLLARAITMAEVLKIHEEEASIVGIYKRELAAVEENLRNADDKQDEIRYSQAVADAKEKLAGYSSEIFPEEAAEILFDNISRFEIAEAYRANEAFASNIYDYVKMIPKKEFWDFVVKYTKVMSENGLKQGIAICSMARKSLCLPNTRRLTG